MKVLLDITRSRPWDSLVMVLCLLFAGLAEGVALSSLLPLFSAISRGGGAGAGSAGEPNQIEAALVGALRDLGIEPTVGALLVIIPVAFGLKNGLLLLARRQMGNTVAKVLTDLRLRLVRALLRTRWSYYVSRPLGSFATAYSADATRAARGYLNATTFVSSLVHMSVYATVALLTSWRVTLAAVGFGAGISLALRGLVRMARRSGERQTDLIHRAINRLTDFLQGVKPLKAMAREGLILPHLERMTVGLEKSLRKEVLSKEALSAIQETISIGLVCTGFFLLWTVFDFPFNEVVLLAAVLMKAFNTAGKLQKSYQVIVVDESAYASLLEKIEEAEACEERRREGSAPTLDRCIAMRDVAFTHRDRANLSGLSLEIPAAQITAFVGPSGAGKTTLVDLIVGLYEPGSGTIEIDGRSLEEIDLSAWRDRIGYVPQETFLLHDSVAVNVSLGDHGVSRPEIERALRDAHAWDFVRRLPDGMDTVVGERGSSLSGGERQRVAIARALVHRPWLLVLDEATANLDPESEAAVWQAIKELRGRVTVLAISHQPALLDVADVVYRIEGGRAERIEPGRPL